MKEEIILLALYTGEDGRRVVGGMDINSGRDWIDVFNDCAHAIRDAGRVVDVKMMPGRVKSANACGF